MILVDTALEEREREGRPIRVAIVGAGYMGRGVALEMLTRRTGMRLVAVANRTLSAAQRAYADAGVDDVRVVENARELDQAIAAGTPAVTDDPLLAAGSEAVDAIVEATGEVEFGARVAVDAIDHGKHVVLMNAELDATVGPILKARADRAGVVITDTDGDEPGVAMNLFRYVSALGFQPVLAGNIKGFIDRYRTPDTQAEFAAKHNQKPPMITSFADGTKFSMEATILANATGFGVSRRGMEGPSYDHVRDMAGHFDLDRLLEGGLVDFVLGAEPGTGAFVVGYGDNPIRAQYLSYFKMGDGPLYLWYQPWHLPNFDLPLTVARAVHFHDAAVAPLGPPSCEVIAVAKRDLHEGDVLDGIGGFDCYGMIENSDVARSDDLFPMGLTAGARLTRDVPKDAALSFGDVETPEGRLADELWAEQQDAFAGTSRRARA
jgi:predicted homoserine dehydrogenase-like protein